MTAATAAGQTAIWLGDESTMEGDWHEPENWDLGGRPGIPGTNNSVQINNNGTARINSGAIATSVTLGQNASDTGTLEIAGANASFNRMIIGGGGSGNLNINGGTVAIADTDVLIGLTGGSHGAVRLNGGTWTGISQLFVGRSGAGTLEVSGGAVIGDFALIGDGSGSSGTVLLSGNSTWTNSGFLRVGNHGAGALSIIGNSMLTNSSAIIGHVDGASGDVIISGGSMWTSSSFLRVGDLGSGSMEITGGSTVANTSATVGTGTRSSGIVQVNGAAWNNSLELTVGNAGTGTLEIVNGGSVSSLYGTIADDSGAVGSVLVSGDGSLWTNGTSLSVGNAGVGTLHITQGASVVNDSGSGFIGGSRGSLGEVVLSGRSTWTIANGALFVGAFGTGSLQIEDRSTLTTDRSFIGDTSSATGFVTVGSASVWANKGALRVGEQGMGSMEVTGGAMVASNSGSIGVSSSAGGEVLVDGAESSWNVGGDLIVGESGAGALHIVNKGSVTSNSGSVGRNSQSSGSVRVSGADSVWSNNGVLTVGKSGVGTLEITDGGKVTAHLMATGDLTVIGQDNNSRGSVVVDGAQSLWTIGSDLAVGRSGAGALLIANGGRVANEYASIGARRQSSGSVRVTGVDSTWSNSRAVIVGDEGAGTLEITAGGTVIGTEGVIGQFAGASGSVLVDGADSKWTNTGALRVGDDGLGTLTIRNNGTVEAAGVIIGSQGNVLANGLILAGVANHGLLAPGQSIGALTIDGDYEQTDGVLEIEVAGPDEGQSDQLIVTGNAMLGGTLVMNFLQGYAPRAGDAIEFLSVGGAFVEQGLSIELANLMPGFEYQTGYNVQSGVFSLTAMNDGRSLGLRGDYNGNGTVEQADLDLVLLHWGQDAGLPPSGWTNDLPSGAIDQDELDDVLLGWGSSNVSATFTAGVPEPNTTSLILVLLFAAPWLAPFTRHAIGLIGMKPMQLLSRMVLIFVVTFTGFCGSSVLAQNRNLAAHTLDNYFQFAGRPGFFNGRLLTYDDLSNEQQYQRQRDRYLPDTEGSLGEIFAPLGRFSVTLFFAEADAVFGQSMDAVDSSHPQAGDFILLNETSGTWRGEVYLPEFDAVYNLEGTFAILVPEPATLALVLFGGIGLLAGRTRAGYGRPGQQSAGHRLRASATSKAAISLAVLTVAWQLLTGSAQAQPHVWKNNITGNWQSNFTWSEPFPPDSTTDVWISNGGTAFVNAAGRAGRDVQLGRLDGEAGHLEVRAAPAMLTVQDLFVGQLGTGTLTISDGGQLANAVSYLGAAPGASGTATVTGAGSTWTNSGELFIGGYPFHTVGGTATLNIQAGGTVSNASGYLGSRAASMGTANVTGAGSIWANNGILIVGEEGTGTLDIQSGGRVSNTAGNIGYSSGSTGMVTVNGPGSQWINAGPLIAGREGTGTLTIADGGSVSSIDGVVGGTVTVTGAGSTWINDGQLFVGQFGSGMLTVAAGSSVSSTTGYIGPVGGSNNTVTVTGAGSSWTNSRDLNVGAGETGRLTVTDSGLVEVGGVLRISQKGVVTLDGGSIVTDSISAFAGAVDTLNFRAGMLTINSDVHVGGSAFPSGLALESHQHVITPATTTIAPLRMLKLDGGSLTTHELIVNGSLDFDRGVLELTGGTIIGLTGLAIPTGGEFRARGIHALQMTGATGSKITATGNLTLGDAVKVNGFYSNGALDVGDNAVTLADANDAVFDSAALVSLGSGGGAGRLSADSGLTLDFGGNITGFGAVDTPNNASLPLVNNGHIAGDSPAEPITISGYVKGVGTLDNVVITGTDAPGFSPATVYRGSVDYQGTLEIELAGLSPGNFDRIIHSGTASLGGALNVSLVDVFTLRAGDSFQILTAAGGIAGEFADELLPALTGDLLWNLVYNVNSVLLEVASFSLPGDYNGNGVVEQTDLDLVLLNWGRDGTVAPTGWTNDLPNGAIDQDELDGVLLGWGNSTTAGAFAAAVPEPRAGALALLLVLTAFRQTVSGEHASRDER